MKAFRKLIFGLFVAAIVSISFQAETKAAVLSGLDAKFDANTGIKISFKLPVDTETYEGTGTAPADGDIVTVSIGQSSPVAIGKYTYSDGDKKWTFAPLSSDYGSFSGGESAGNAVLSGNGIETINKVRSTLGAASGNKKTTTLGKVDVAATKSGGAAITDYENVISDTINAYEIPDMKVDPAAYADKVQYDILASDGTVITGNFLFDGEKYQIKASDKTSDKIIDNSKYTKDWWQGTTQKGSGATSDVCVAGATNTALTLYISMPLESVAFYSDSAKTTAKPIAYIGNDSNLKLERYVAVTPSDIALDTITWTYKAKTGTTTGPLTKVVATDGKLTLSGFPTAGGDYELYAATGTDTPIKICEFKVLVAPITLDPDSSETTKKAFKATATMPTAPTGNYTVTLKVDHPSKEAKNKTWSKTVAAGASISETYPKDNVSEYGDYPVFLEATHASVDGKITASTSFSCEKDEPGGDGDFAFVVDPIKLTAGYYVDLYNSDEDKAYLYSDDKTTLVYAVIDKPAVATVSPSVKKGTAIKDLKLTARAAGEAILYAYAPGDEEATSEAAVNVFPTAQISIPSTASSTSTSSISGYTLIIPTETHTRYNIEAVDGIQLTAVAGGKAYYFNGNSWNAGGQTSTTTNPFGNNNALASLLGLGGMTMPQTNGNVWVNYSETLHSSGLYTTTTLSATALKALCKQLKTDGVDADSITFSIAPYGADVSTGYPVVDSNAGYSTNVNLYKMTLDSSAGAKYTVDGVDTENYFYALDGLTYNVASTASSGGTFSKWEGISETSSSSATISAYKPSSSHSIRAVYTGGTSSSSSSSASDGTTPSKGAGSDSDLDDVPKTGESKADIWILWSILLASILGAGFMVYKRFGLVKAISRVEAEEAAAEEARVAQAEAEEKENKLQMLKDLRNLK